MIANKNIGMLCMQELIFWGGWITRNIVSDFYIFTKGKKSINVEKNANVQLPHTQVFCGRLCVGRLKFEHLSNQRTKMML